VLTSHNNSGRTRSVLTRCWGEKTSWVVEQIKFPSPHELVYFRGQMASKCAFQLWIHMFFFRNTFTLVSQSHLNVKITTAAMLLSVHIPRHWIQPQIISSVHSLRYVPITFVEWTAHLSKIQFYLQTVVIRDRYEPKLNSCCNFKFKK
jgi:hypothetical protein